MAAESHAAAIDQIESIVQAENIDCGFERVNGYLFSPPGESSSDLQKELAATHRAGLMDTELVHTPLIASPCLRFPRQAQFHPLKYMSALVRAIVRDGGRIHTQTHALKISGGNPAYVETSLGWKIASEAIIVTTNTPVNDLLTIHTKQAAYRTFVIAASVPKGSIRNDLYWDTSDPYHYVRLLPHSPTHLSLSEDLLIVGGEDHKTGQANDAEVRYARLEQWARTFFPAMAEVKFRWSGQVYEPVDGLAFIGSNPMDKKNVFVATGFSGNGMTYGTIAGMLLTDLIQGRENIWSKLYEPARKSLKAVKTFAEENFNTAVQYTDWLTKGDVKEVALIAPGTGAIVRRGLKKIAAYHATDGFLHECSAVCPHLGGIVAWNHSEQTWDCPCHGSRFNKFGKVVTGPAITNLTTHDAIPHINSQTTNNFMTEARSEPLGDPGPRPMAGE